MAKEINLRIGEDWHTNLPEIAKIKPYIHDQQFRTAFTQIKQENKRKLAEYILKHEGIEIPEHFIFDIQIKRLHEYKRQLMNAFGILYTYFGLKDGSIKDFKPTAYIFGAKSAPGYYMAKAIIKYINEIAKLINSDEEVADKMKVVFVQNYNVSYAEKLVCAADISEQISLAGMEASGTGNMKFMLNGTVTLGTLDGANVEICEEAGIENNYIFGATVEQVKELRNKYDPKAIIESDPKIKRVVNTLIDGHFNDNGTGVLKNLYLNLTEGYNPDYFMMLNDLKSFISKREELCKDFGSEEFTTKCLINMASAGKFSSDRSVKEYAEIIWKV
jgi:starch phosphorylase